MTSEVIEDSGDTPSASKNTPASATAAVLVTVACALFIGAIIMVLAFHLQTIHAKPDDRMLASVDLSCDTEVCRIEQARLDLEQKALFQRTDRTRTALSSRLIINVIAEIVALTLIVLGGVLIFDRIQGSGETLGLKGKDPVRKWAVNAGTAFPGVMLCAFGSITLVFAMWFPTTPGAKISVVDLPVFVEDRNIFRNTVLGQAAGTNTQRSKNGRSAPSKNSQTSRTEEPELPQPNLEDQDDAKSN